MPRLHFVIVGRALAGYEDAIRRGMKVIMLAGRFEGEFLRNHPAKLLGDKANVSKR
jgi:hypothetical protein